MTSPKTNRDTEEQKDSGNEAPIAFKAGDATPQKALTLSTTEIILVTVAILALIWGMIMPAPAWYVAALVSIFSAALAQCSFWIRNATTFKSLSDKPRRETADCGRGEDVGEDSSVCTSNASPPAQENNSSANGFQPDAHTVSAQTNPVQ